MAFLDDLAFVVGYVQGIEVNVSSTFVSQNYLDKAVLFHCGFKG